MKTTFNQTREKTRQGEKITTTIHLGPHKIETVEYTSNNGYYAKVNGRDVLNGKA